MRPLAMHRTEPPKSLPHRAHRPCRAVLKIREPPSYFFGASDPGERVTLPGRASLPGRTLRPAPRLTRISQRLIAGDSGLC
eukprot:763187-Hanusia_phi.AAC.2